MLNRQAPSCSYDDSLAAKGQNNISIKNRLKIPIVTYLWFCSEGRQLFSLYDKYKKRRGYVLTVDDVLTTGPLCHAHLHRILRYI